MYIRSKDRKVLVNLNNIIAIYANLYTIYAITNSNEYLIHTCETKEETLETLDYIQNKLILEETIEL